MLASSHRVPWRSRIALACAALAGCSPGGDADLPAAAPSAADPPPLVVSLSPLATRFVLALGADPLLLAVDAASAAALPELAELPVVDLAGASALAPDLVLVPALPDPTDPALRALWDVGAQVVDFAPHSFEDVSALCRSLGAQLVGAERALSFEVDYGQPLALIGGLDAWQPRPRVLAVTGLDPLEVAGGHSFETDLIEIAGGSSVTHEINEPRLALTPERLRELAPDLLVVSGAAEPTPSERQQAEAALPPGYRIAFFAFDRDLFWLGDAAADARRLRALIEPVARELDARERKVAP